MVIDETDIKHCKYLKYYQKNDIFWGCGIENETYLFCEDYATVKGSEIINNKKRERYSVDYYENFNQESLCEFMYFIVEDRIYNIPLIINSHYLQKCDIFGNHKTTYTASPQPNPIFSGKTCHELMMENEILVKMYDENFVFDGDSIEFITINFYKNTVKKCIEELVMTKKTVLDNMNIALNKSLKFQTHNPGFAKYLTNPNNINICNNGTYHINITLPTKLDKYTNIADYALFRDNHKKFIRLIQWLEPLFIACYGSPDIMSTVNTKFAKGSQRCALSRYIGLGTFDSSGMVKGKQLDNFDPIDNQYTWYNLYHSNSGYNPLKTIGFDINFNKFKNHGIEIRFFDYFPECYLEDVLNIIVLCGELALLQHHIKNPIKKKIWNETIKSCVSSGYQAKLPKKFVNKISYVFGISTTIDSPKKLFQLITNDLYQRFYNGWFAEKISPNMQQPVIKNYNKKMMMLHADFLKCETKNESF